MVVKSKKLKKAQAAVELAIIMPFLLLLLLSIIELGVFFSDFMQLNFAVQYAGDCGKVRGVTNNQIVQIIQDQVPEFNFAPGSNINNGQPANVDSMSIKPFDLSSRPNGGWIFIRATHHYKFITPLVGGLMVPEGRSTGVYLYPMTSYTTRRIE